MAEANLSPCLERHPHIEAWQWQHYAVRGFIIRNWDIGKEG